MLEARPNWNVAHTARRVGEGGSDDEPIADDVSNRFARDAGRVVRPLGSVTMAGVVLRVRLNGGDHIDVTYDEPDTVETAFPGDLSAREKSTGRGPPPEVMSLGAPVGREGRWSAWSSRRRHDLAADTTSLQMGPSVRTR